MEDVGGHAMAQLQQEHEKKRHVLQAASSKLEKLVHSIQEYSRQKLENDMVLNELNMLSEDSTVYKRIGPCLVKQDMFEATSNVQKRIDYIMDELERLEKQKAVYDKEHKETTQQLQNIQVQVQRIMQSPPRVGRSVLRTNSNGHLQELQAAGQLET